MPSRRPGLPRHPNAAPSVRDRRSPAHPASCTPRRCPATARRSARRLSRAPARVGDRRWGARAGGEVHHELTRAPPRAWSTAGRGRAAAAARRGVRSPPPNPRRPIGTMPTRVGGSNTQAYPRRGQGHGLPSRRLVVRGRHGDGPPRDHPQRDLRELAEESLKRWSALRAARMASIAAAAPAIGHGEGNGAGQGHSSRQMTPWPVDASVLLADEGDDPNHADAGSCSEAPIRWPPWTSPVPRSRTWR
jgi:hypothetical protein